MSLPELVDHDKMVSDRTVSSLRLWAQDCGAVFPQDAELGKMVERACKTLSSASREDLGELQLMFAIGMEPFVVALRAGGRFPKGGTNQNEKIKLKIQKNSLISLFLVDIPFIWRWSVSKSSE